MSELRDTQYKDSSNFSARINLHRFFGTNPYPWPKWVFDHFRQEENLAVLEMGCGTGLLWRFNVANIPESWNVRISDFSAGMLEAAKNSIGDSLKQAEYEVVDIENIPHEDNRWDMIIANHMLYHVENREKALGEVARVLKDDGVFYATTIREDYMSIIREIIQEFKTGTPGEGHSNAVIAGFTLENDRDQLLKFFGEVKKEKYENTLKISEAGPFMDYILSMKGMAGDDGSLRRSDRDSLHEFIENKIIREGSIMVPADFGIFVCREAVR